MAYTPLPDGELVAVVTYLEMRGPPVTGDCPQGDCPLTLTRIDQPGLDQYRRLFRLVGGRWLWFSRLAMADAALAAIVGDPKVEIYAVVDESGGEAGMLELDFRVLGECELAYVGLVPELAGQGHGRWLLTEALRLAWREGNRRIHVHTCSLDHPAALSAYRRAGFTPFKRAIERFPDPRLTGILPRDCAPQVPLLGTEASTAEPPVS